MTQITLNTSLNKVKKFITGKGVTMYPDKDFNGEEKLELNFEKLADYNRMVKNFKAGKGFILKQSQLKDVLHNGSGIKEDMRRLKRGWNKFVNDPTVKKIGKFAIKNLAVPAGEALGTAAGAYMGNPQLGMMAGQMIGEVVADKYGNGVMQDMGRKFTSVARKGLTRYGKPALREAIKVGKREFNTYKPILKDMAKEVIKKKIAESGIADDVERKVTGFTGQSQHGQFAKQLMYDAVDKALPNETVQVGGAVEARKRGRPKKATATEVKEAEMKMGLGGTRLNFKDIKEKMAYVRSCRRKVGGSMLVPV